MECLFLFRSIENRELKFYYFKIEIEFFRTKYGKMKMHYQRAHYGLNFCGFILNNLIMMNMLLLFDKLNPY
jgi:hypothetical protein